jgi:ABC-2 type transport system permease protein
MAVFERNYHAYSGTLTPRNTRFLVLPRYAYREMMASKLFTAFLVFCFIWPLVLSILMYIPHNSTFLMLIQAQMSDVSIFNFGPMDYFFWFMIPQGWLAFFLAFIVGPALVSADLRNNALPLYFSRPFSRTEYVLGKTAVLIVLMSMITWVPGLLLFLWQGSLEGLGWMGDNLRIAAAIFLSSWIWILLLCLVSLAISAYARWRPLARAGFVLVFLVPLGLAPILNTLFKTQTASLINIIDMVRVVWTSLFGIQSWVTVPLGGAWLSLLIACAICLWLLSRKIRPLEVVR